MVCLCHSSVKRLLRWTDISGPADRKPVMVDVINIMNFELVKDLALSRQNVSGIQNCEAVYLCKREHLNTGFTYSCCSR